jgi:hypothetical protein
MHTCIQAQHASTNFEHALRVPQECCAEARTRAQGQKFHCKSDEHMHAFTHDCLRQVDVRTTRTCTHTLYQARAEINTSWRTSFVVHTRACTSDTLMTYKHACTSDTLMTYKHACTSRTHARTAVANSRLILNGITSSCGVAALFDRCKHQRVEALHLF